MAGDRFVVPLATNPTLRRSLFAGLVIASTLVATAVLGQILSPGGFAWTDGVLLILFALLFAWICASFWTVMLGFCAMLAARLRPGVRGRGPGTVDTSPSRTALLVPICNEDVVGVFARIEATWRSLRDVGAADLFDIFVLSDTTDAETWIEEEIAWQDLCRKLGTSGQLFYRHRVRNTDYKSGNIADFCRRWGRRYRYMIVFDADSLMSGVTMVELVRRMDQHPNTGLIQTVPMAVHGRTLFARMQQFAANLCGPAYAMGAAFWQLDVGNYWGHNAIIRVAAFMRHCGLPKLSGHRPLGGQILSHDFVEAALLVRGGWQVRIAPDLRESYEETPPTLLAYAKRDSRWCQGNLQHIRLIFARGLHPLSRQHLAMGAMTYLASPLWLLFVAVSAADLWRRVHADHVYFKATSRFPLWPVSHATQALSLFIVTLALLYLPKMLGLAFLLADRDRRAAFGGGLAVCVSVLVENLLSALVAPVLMAFHTRFVALTLLGRDTGWTPQQRARGQPRFRAVAAAHAEHVIAGLAAGLAAYDFLPELFWWLVPVIAGPVLAVPLNLALSSRTIGRAARRLRIFLVPSESRPSPLLRSFRHTLEEAASRRRIRDGAGATTRVLRDPRLNALHVALLETPVPSRPKDSVVRRAEVHGLSVLTAEEQRVLLSDADCVMRLHVRRGTGSEISA